MRFFVDAFDFSSSKTGETGSAQRAISALRAFQLYLSSNCSGDLYLCCEGRFLEVYDTPTVNPPSPRRCPHPTVAPPPPPKKAPPPPPCAPPSPAQPPRGYV